MVPRFWPPELAPKIQLHLQNLQEITNSYRVPDTVLPVAFLISPPFEHTHFT